MKGFIKKSISVFLAAVLTFGLIPVSAFAAADVATVNGTNYTSYTSAWEAAKTGGSITLLADWKTSSWLEVSSGANLIIDLNGHTIDRGLAVNEDSEGDGSVLRIHNNAVVTIKNGTITGGCSDSYAGGIIIREQAQVTLENVSVTGNRAEYWFGDGNGGGIILDGKYAKLYLKNSHVYDNYAESYGGGIYISNYENCEIHMSEGSTISNNRSDGGYGGGIYVNGHKAKILGELDAAGEITCGINDNNCDNDGGGIYVNGDNAVIRNLNIINNVASVDGGGVFADNEGCTIKDCVIYGNKTGTGISREGGGVFIDNDACTLDGCVIRGNTAEDYGGGVYVTSTANINLSGNLIIKDNEADGKADNLHLNSVVTSSVLDVSFISGFPTSEPNSIGVTRGGGSSTKYLSADRGQYDSSIYFPDKSGNYIYWDYDYTTGQGNRYLMMTSNASEVKTQELPKAEVEMITSEDERISVIKDGYNGYDVTRGIYNYCKTEYTNYDNAAVFYYTDGYFAENPAVYNNHLATMSTAMIMASGNSNVHKMTNYTNKFYSAKQLLADIGCDVDHIYVSETYAEKPTKDSVAFVIGHKELCDERNKKTGEILLPVSIRGISYEQEWISNVTIGQNGEAQGFSTAASKVEEQLKTYIQEQGLQDELASGKVKFWVTGYSRSGAIANLLSKRLIDTYSDSGNKIFAYCIAAPQAGREELEDKTKDYNSIHNVINKRDLVPLFPTKEMGFKRYGVDHYVAGTEDTDSISLNNYTYSYGNSQVNLTLKSDNSQYAVDLTEGSAYAKVRKEMINQLSMVSPGTIFDDYFRLATMNYLTSTLGLQNMNTELSNGTLMVCEEWLEEFIRHLQEWAFNSLGGKDYNGDFRECYSSGKLVSNGISIQEAAGVMMGILYGKSTDETERIMEAVLSHIDDIDMFSIWDDVIGDWDEISAQKREQYRNDLWNILVASNGRDASAADYLTEKELTELRAAWDVVADVLFRFVSEDYNYDGVGNVSQVFLGTLLYNVTNILNTHYSELYVSWLRAYDSFYTEGLGEGAKEVKAYKIDNTQDDFIPNVPTAYIDGKEAANHQYFGNQTLELRANRGASQIDSAGTAIYYKVEQIKSGKTTDAGYRLYNGPIELSADEECTYKISTYSMAFTNKSAEAVYSIDITNQDMNGTLADNNNSNDTMHKVDAFDTVGTTITKDVEEERASTNEEETTLGMTGESDSDQKQENQHVASLFGRGSLVALFILALVVIGGTVRIIFIKKKQ